MQRTITELSQGQAIDEAVPPKNQIEAFEEHKRWLMDKLLSTEQQSHKMPRDKILEEIRRDKKKLFFQGVGEYPCPRRYNPYRCRDNDNEEKI